MTAAVYALRRLEKERQLQRLDWVYGNLAASTRHRPRLEAFRELAAEMGIEPDEFAAWAKDKEWVP